MHNLDLLLAIQSKFQHKERLLAALKFLNYKRLERLSLGIFGPRKNLGIYCSSLLLKGVMFCIDHEHLCSQELQNQLMKLFLFVSSTSIWWVLDWPVVNFLEFDCLTTHFAKNILFSF